MKTDVYLSINIGANKTYITVEDSSSDVTFLEVKITPENLSKLLSGQGSIKCEATIDDLELVGKTHEYRKFDFEIPYELYKNGSAEREKIEEIGDNLLTDGWKIDSSFNSQDSFFKKDGKYYANGMIRRYV